MGLRAFHVVFVTMATALALAFAWWCYRGFQLHHSAVYALGAAGGAITAAALAVYGIAFYRKFGKAGPA